MSDAAIAAQKLDFQHLALSDAMLAADRSFQFRKHFVDCNSREKAQTAEVDRKQRNLAAADRAGSRQERTVAAEHDRQIAAFRDLQPGKGFAVCGVSGRFLIAADAQAAR